MEIHAIQPLADDNIMIAESGPGRIIEVDRTKAVEKVSSCRLTRQSPS